MTAIGDDGALELDQMNDDIDKQEDLVRGEESFYRRCVFHSSSAGCYLGQFVFAIEACHPAIKLGRAVLLF